MVIPLGWIGSEDEVPALIQALQNEDKDVRVNAIAVSYTHLTLPTILLV